MRQSKSTWVASCISFLERVKEQKNVRLTGAKDHGHKQQMQRTVNLKVGRYRPSWSRAVSNGARETLMSTSGDEQHPADHFAVSEFPMRFGCSIERERFPHDWLECIRVHELQHFL